MRLSKNARSMISRAYKSGIEVVRAHSEQEFDQFVCIYKQTMTRLAADEFYYFNDRYFEQLSHIGRLIRYVGSCYYLGENFCRRYFFGR